MEIFRNVFVNKRTKQFSLTIPKKQIEKQLKVKLPDKLKVKITIPKLKIR